MRDMYGAQTRSSFLKGGGLSGSNREAAERSRGRERNDTDEKELQKQGCYKGAGKVAGGSAHAMQAWIY